MKWGSDDGRDSRHFSRGSFDGFLSEGDRAVAAQPDPEEGQVGGDHMSTCHHCHQAESDYKTTVSVTCTPTSKGEQSMPGNYEGARPERVSDTLAAVQTWGKPSIQPEIPSRSHSSLGRGGKLCPAVPVRPAACGHTSAQREKGEDDAGVTRDVTGRMESAREPGPWLNSVPPVHVVESWPQDLRERR